MVFAHLIVLRQFFRITNLYPIGYVSACDGVICTLTGIKVTTSVDIIPVRVYFCVVDIFRS
jgi:hypothetical protein